MISSGVISCLWFIGWALYAYNSPAEHPRIEYQEKIYLLRSVPKQKRVKVSFETSYYSNFINISLQLLGIKS